MTEDDSHDDFGYWYAECRGCDRFASVDDMGLCSECADKFERDLIRKRCWDYSASAFGVPPEKREDLRRQVVEQYGEDLEIICPDTETKRGDRGRRERKIDP